MRKSYSIDLGASYKLKISNSSKLNILSFYTKRIFSNKLPFENGGQVDLKRSYWGLSAKYIIDNYFLKNPYPLQLVSISVIKVIGESDITISKELEGQEFLIS